MDNFTVTEGSVTVATTIDEAVSLHAKATPREDIIGYLFWFQLRNTLIDRVQYNARLGSMSFSDSSKDDTAIKRELEIRELHPYHAFRSATKRAVKISRHRGKNTTRYLVEDVVTPGEDEDNQGLERRLVREVRDPADRRLEFTEAARFIYLDYLGKALREESLEVQIIEDTPEVQGLCHGVKAAYSEELVGASTRRFKTAVDRCVTRLHPVSVHAASLVYFCRPDYEKLISSLSDLVDWVDASFKHPGGGHVKRGEFRTVALTGLPSHVRMVKAAVKDEVDTEVASLVETIRRLEKNPDQLDEGQVLDELTRVKTRVIGLKTKVGVYQVELQDNIHAIRDDLSLVLTAYDRILGV